MNQTIMSSELNLKMPRVKTVALSENQEKVEKMYIDGQWVKAHTERTFEVCNPATGELVAKVANGGRKETKQAIDAAHLALNKWTATSAKQREKILKKVQQIMQERADEIAKLIVLENGTSFKEAKGEVSFALGYFNWFTEKMRHAYDTLISFCFSCNGSWLCSYPFGVVAAITSSNFSVAAIVRKLVPALAAGCTVVLKPSERTPLTALAIAQICHDAGVPSGVLNVVIGSNPFPLSGEILNNPKVKKMRFTSPTEAGKLLMEKAVKFLKHISFQLGYILAIWDYSLQISEALVKHLDVPKYDINRILEPIFDFSSFANVQDSISLYSAEAI